MSGGTFDYIQFQMDEAVKTYARELVRIEKLVPEDVVVKLIVGLQALQQASLMLHRADYLFAGDDGPESYLENLDHDVKAEVSVFDVLAIERERLGAESKETER
jgi:hypothetical protein